MKGKVREVSAGKRFRFQLETFAMRSLAWLIPKLSRQTVLQIGRRLGWLAYYLAPEPRRIAMANLDVAFGASKTRKEKQRIALASMESFVTTLLGLFWSPRLTREVVEEIVELDLESLERVRDIQARGQGIIFVTLHYGDWELLGLASGFYGLPTTIVQEWMTNKALEDIFAGLRGQTGHRVVPSRFAALTLLKTLKKGGNIALLIDLNATGKRGGVWLDFFGAPVFNHAAVGGLAAHSNATIICSAARPLPDGRCRIVYEPMVETPRTGDAVTDAKAIDQACLRYCEEVIRRTPEYWLWSYKRWKFRPTEEQGKLPYYARYWPPVAAHFES